MRALCLNVRSLDGKVIYLETLSELCNSEILLLSETWFTDRHQSIVENFTLIANSSRSDTKKGHFGGSAIYVRTDPSITVNFTNSVKPSGDCNVSIAIVNNVSFVNIYRSPNQSKEDEQAFIDYLKTLDYPNMVIVGDLNLPAVNWTNHTSPNSFFNEVAQVILMLGCQNYVNDSTHLRGNLLDVCLAQDGLVHNVEVMSDLIFPSDHFAITMSINCDRIQDNKKVIKLFKKLKTEDYQAKLSAVNWCLIDYNNVDQATEIITKTILNIYEDCLPTKIAVPDRKFEKFSPKIVAQINTCKYFKRKGQSDKLREAQVLLNEYIQEAKVQNIKNYLDRLESSRDNIYSIFRKHQVKNMVTCTRDCHDNLVYEPKEVARILNTHFASVFSEGDGEIDIDWSDKSDLLLDNIEITESAVYDVITKTKRSNGVGPDHLSTSMLIDAARQLVFPLTVLFRRIMNTGKVPQQFRNACICPIPKKPDSSRPSHVRNICKESVLGKCLEKLVLNKMYASLESIDYFPPSQYGFRKGRGCVNNLEDFHDCLHQALADGFQVAVCFADLSRAFDVVNHRLVLKAIHRAGIRGLVGQYLQAWLADRKQWTVFKNEKSDQVDVTSSIIQGSNLATLLFLVLKNDLPNYIKYCTLYDFADDSKLVFKYKHQDELWMFERDIENLQDWATDVKQLLNMTKTVAINFGGEFKRNIYARNTPMCVADQIKDLGIWISSSKGLAEHHDVIVRKLCLAAHAAKKSIKGATFKVRSFIWTTYLFPIMNYASSVWSTQKVGEKLDEHYKSFFQDSHPDEGDEIPLTPSQSLLRIILLRTLKWRSTCKSRSAWVQLTTRQTPFSERFNDTNDFIPPLPTHGWAAKSLFERARPHWNYLSGNGTVSVTVNAIENYVRSEDSGCRGVVIWTKLGLGKLVSGYTKRQQWRAAQQKLHGDGLNSSF